MEKEFKSKKFHKDKISCLTKVSGTEFFTSAEDCAFKLWDRDLQGCSYTYETHEPLDNMCLTGDKMQYLIAGLGRGNFLVMGVEKKNQCDIIEAAHDDKII